MALLAHRHSRLWLRIFVDVERRWSCLVWSEVNEVQARFEKRAGRRLAAVQDEAVRFARSQLSSVLPSNKQMQLTIGSAVQSTVVASGTIVRRFERRPLALPLATDL
jgi:hypothetical protein